jgi:hypothetical protein
MSKKYTFEKRAKENLFTTKTPYFGIALRVLTLIEFCLLLLFAVFTVFSTMVVLAQKGVIF